MSSSASSSGMSISNSCSKTITNSTVSKESAPRSSIKLDSNLISDADLASLKEWNSNPSEWMK